MESGGSVRSEIADGIGTLIFHHPKKNSLPGDLLRKMATEVDRLGADDRIRVVVLASQGDGPFCAGASFDELLSIRTLDEGTRFFMGFAGLILALRRCPKFVLARVQGKVVGGGVGLVAASDYVFARSEASLKLSEFALGFGPFVIGPAVERKVGSAAFASAAIDADWRDADWARRHNLYTHSFEQLPDLDEALGQLAAQLAASNPEAISELKRIFWQGTEHWDSLLPERAAISARLVLTDFVAAKIQAFKRS